LKKFRLQVDSHRTCEEIPRFSIKFSTAFAFVIHQ